MAKIMVVEDEEKYMARIARIVGEKGHVLSQFRTPRKALAAYDEERPDMVITDYTGFPLDGVGLTRGIRDRGDEIPVYIQSQTRPEEKEFQYSGATGFMPKEDIEEQLPVILQTHFGDAQ